MRLPGPIHIVLQRDAIPDCTVAALATYLGLKYEKVLAAAVTIQPRVLATGLSDRNVRRVAKTFGVTLKALTPAKYDLREDSGILAVVGMNHVVVLWNGLILELRESTLWIPEEYLEHHQARAGNLMVVA